MTDWQAIVDTALQECNDAESHVERDAKTFHPSQLASCTRQCYLGKLGLKDMSGAFGAFQTGSLIHEWLEEHVEAQHPEWEYETPVEYETGGIVIKGTADVYDALNDRVIDYKTRSSWYRFDPPVGRHVNQVHCYMAGLSAEQWKIVYLHKGKLEVKEWPVSEPGEFDEKRLESLVHKAQHIRNTIQEHGVAEAEDEIPFDKCGCFPCEQEELDL